MSLLQTPSWWGGGLAAPQALSLNPTPTLLFPHSKIATLNAPNWFRLVTPLAFTHVLTIDPIYTMSVVDVCSP